MDTWSYLGSLINIPKSIILNYDSVTVIQAETIPTVLTEHFGNDPTTKHILEDDTHRYHLVERYNSQIYIDWGVKELDLTTIQFDQKELNVAKISKVPYPNPNIENFNIKIFFPFWEEDSNPEVEENIKLSMTPPGDKQSPVKIEAEIANPRTYLETKYYEALFSIQIPLAYFVKSNLIRFKNMCRTTYNSEFEMAYQATLLDMLLTIPKFDQRHDLNALVSNSIFTNPIALDCKDACLNKYHLSRNIEQPSTQLSDLSFVLKARELKLQIVILLELIYLNGRDDNFKNFERRYKSKLKKRALNVTRIATRRNKLNKEHKKDPNTKKDEEVSLDLCEQLDVYLDKLNIVDILLGSEVSNPDLEADNNPIHEQKQNILNKNKEASSVGFANYVLIPYFVKKLPNAVSFIISKLA